MFSRNFGGIAWAATIASRFTGSPPPAASSITARTAYSAFAVTRIATHCPRPVAAPACRVAGARTQRVRAATLPRCLVFPTNPIKKGEKDSSHDSLPLEAPPRRGRERRSCGRAAPRRRRLLAAAALSAVLALGIAACGGSSEPPPATAAAARSTSSATRLPRRPTTEDARARLQRDPRRRGRRVLELLRRLGRPVARGRGRPAGGRLHFALEPDMTRAGRRRPRRR